MLGINQLSLVESIIGTDATDLVELFSSLNRPNSLELALLTNSLKVTAIDGAVKTLDQETLDNLCAIESMNLHEQSLLVAHPELYKWFFSKNQPIGE